MSLFNDVTLVWGGTEYTIKSDNVLRLIAQVEDVITFAELYRFGLKGAIPQARIATAFGTMLRYAGAQVGDDEVYKAMFKDGGAHAVTAVRTLLEIMSPPETISTATGASGEGKEIAAPDS